MLRVRQPVGARIQPVGGERHVVGDDVASQARRAHVNGAVHFLPVNARVHIQRMAARALAAVAHFIQAARLARRVGGDGAHGGQRVRARRAGVPHVVIAVLLHRHAQLLRAIQPVAVLADERARVIARVRNAAARLLVILVARQRSAQHQRVIALAEVTHARAAQAPAGRVIARAGMELHARLKARLRQPHIDRAAQSARAIQHRSRAFHHFHAIGQPQRHERGHGPRWLRGVEPHAIDQQHHAVALEAANHRIHALRAIQRNGQPRLAAHGFAHIARLLARQVFAREHCGGNGRFGGIGRVALGRDGDSGQAGIIRRIRRAVFLRVRCALRVNMRGQQGGCGQGDTGRAVHLGRTPHQTKQIT